MQRKLRDQLQQAAKLKQDAFLLDQELERAASRARMVRERNLQLVKACDADPQKANGRALRAPSSEAGYDVEPW